MSHVEVDPPPGAPRDGEPIPARPPSSSRIWAFALAAGLIAGFASWPIGDVIHARYAPPEFINMASSSGGFISTAEVQKLTRAKQARQVLEAALFFGASGAILGAAFGLAGCYAGRPAGSARNALLFGALVGAASGAAAAAASLPVYLRFLNTDTNDLAMGFMFQALTAAAMGAAAGASFAVGLGDRGRIIPAIVGGLMGAVAGVLVYEAAGALAFPLDKTSSPISATTLTRLLGRLSVAVLAAAGVAMGVLDKRKPKPTPGPVAAA
jgi:hypothetical protein